MEGKIKYELSVENDSVKDTKRNLKDYGLKVVKKFDMPDCGTCLVIEGDLEEIEGFCDDFEFDYSEDNIVE